MEILRFTPTDPAEIERINEQFATGMIDGALSVAHSLPRIMADPDPTNRRVRLMAARVLVNRAWKPDLRSRLSAEQLATLKQIRADLRGKR